MAGFFRDHFKGDHSLVQVVLLTILIANLHFMVVDAIASIVGIINNPVIRNQIYIVWITLLFGGFVPVQWIGLYNACKFQIETYSNYGGVIVAVTTSALATWLLIHYVFPTTVDIQNVLRIAQAKDSYSIELHVSENYSLDISGTLYFGAAKNISEIISKNKITEITLNITAGHLYEARKLADLVAEHEINVTVNETCLTPCPLILASGKVRTVSEEAIIGFQSYKELYPDHRSNWFVEQKQKADIEQIGRAHV